MKYHRELYCIKFNLAINNNWLTMDPRVKEVIEASIQANNN